MASSASDINKVYLEMSKLSNQTQIKLQELTNQSTAKSFEYNAKEAEKSRSWQTQMSNTSHQREVKDLIAAGLNPVLSSGGNGAQSYTTSSASAQADNAASAVGQLAASRITGLAGMQSSKMGADATRAAAASNAAAMKAAAAQSAAAQRYAADAARYAADMQYRTQVDVANINAAASKYRVDNEVPKSIAGALWKLGNQAGINKPLANGIGAIWNGLDKYGIQQIKNIASDLKKGTTYYQIAHPDSGIAVMSRLAQRMSAESLRKLDLDTTAQNKLIFFKATICNDKVAQAMLRNLLHQRKAKQVRDAVSNFANFLG